MNALTKWNPFRELEEIQNRMSSVFGRTPVRGSGQEAMTVSEWTPLVDITEDDKEYLIKAELPEVKKEDVKLTVENGTLTITGERKVREGGEGQEVSSHGTRLRLVHAEFYPSRRRRWRQDHCRLQRRRAQSASAEKRRGKAKIDRSSG